MTTVLHVLPHTHSRGDSMIVWMTSLTRCKVNKQIGNGSPNDCKQHFVSLLLFYNDKFVSKSVLCCAGALQLRLL